VKNECGLEGVLRRRKGLEEDEEVRRRRGNRERRSEK
jgi:hypothetical protein